VKGDGSSSLRGCDQDPKPAPELIDEPEPGHFANVALEVHQQLGQPGGVVPDG
jgi:hypothetical protein